MPTDIIDGSVSLPPVNPPQPAELDWLVKLIGPVMTFRLVKLHGGTRVYVPKRAAPGQKLACELSPEAEAALVQEFSGMLVSIPLAKAWRAQVYEARGEGTNSIARRLETGVDTIQRYLARRRPRPRGALCPDRGGVPSPAGAGAPGGRP